MYRYDLLDLILYVQVDTETCSPGRSHQTNTLFKKNIVSFHLERYDLHTQDTKFKKKTVRIQEGIRYFK